MIVIAILIVTVNVLIYLWVQKRYRYWTDHGFLSEKPIFPVGNLWGVGYKYSEHEAMEKFYNKYKGKTPAVGLYFFFTPTLLIIDPELIRNISVKEFASFHDRTVYYNKENDPLSANVLTFEGKEWRDVRTKLTPIFTSGKMKMMFGIVNEIGDKFAKVLCANSAIKSEQEMRNWFARYTCDVIGNIAFGIDCNCLDNPKSEFKKYGARVFDITPLEYLKFMFSTSWPKLSRKLGLRLHPKESTDFFLKTFLKTIEEREEKNISRPDFVQLLIQIKKETNGSFTNTELAAESFIFYVGGFETSSTLMTFCAYELALNPDIQDRLREEIKEYLENCGGELSYNTLFEMEYLEKVINGWLLKSINLSQVLISNRFRNPTKIPTSSLCIIFVSKITIY
jgi:cytochrome P450 family 6